MRKLSSTNFAPTSVNQSVRKELFGSVSQSERSSLCHGALLLYSSSYFLTLSLIPSRPWQESRSRESLREKLLLVFSLQLEKWIFMSRSPLDFQEVEKTFLFLLSFFEIFILKFSFSSRFSRFSKQIIFSSRYTRFCPLFLILRKFTFLKVGGVFPPTSV